MSEIKIKDIEQHKDTVKKLGLKFGVISISLIMRHCKVTYKKAKELFEGVK